MSLLKELPLKSGTINVTGEIAYASQEPWAFNASVRENILFGKEYDEKKYNEIVRVCVGKWSIKNFLVIFEIFVNVVKGNYNFNLSYQFIGRASYFNYKIDFD